MNYNDQHHDHPPYMDTQGGAPGINYGNELSRERLSYSQVGFTHILCILYQPIM